jgi:chromosome segregation ATPase
VEARATLVEMEAWDRVLKIVAGIAASLAFVHGEADEFAQKVALLEAELADVRPAQDKAEMNVQSLFDKMANVNRRWEDTKRQCRDLV